MATARLDLEELRRILGTVVGEARVSTRAVDRSAYARDMWPRLLISARAGAAAPHPPDVVVWPETLDELTELVRLARRLRIPVVPYGAGSGVVGGAVPIFGGITIDLKRMDRILGVDAEAGTVTVEAGLTGEHLERSLARQELTLGHFPSSIYCSTVGGWLAARSAGQMSTKYGKIEDMVMGLTAVTGRGDVITTGRFGRAAAGPDWTQLLVGSEGTLAVIASARLRVRPQPEVRLLRGFEFPRVPAGLEAIRRVLQRGLRPAVVRLYDEFDTLMALYGHKTGGEAPAAPTDGDLLARLRGMAPGATGKAGPRSANPVRKLFSGALDHPLVLNTVADALARRVGRKGCLLVVGIEGARRRADVEAGLVFGELARAGGRDLGEEPGRRWYEHRYAVSYKMPKVFAQGAFVDTMEVASTWERLVDLYDEVRRAISKHAFVMAHFSHAYSEGCSIYFTFVGHAPTHTEAEERYDRIWQAGMEAVHRAGGTISHHHGVGLLKAPFMQDEHRESMAIYQAIKRSFDPDGILNPGKMGLAKAEQGWTTITRS